MFFTEDGTFFDIINDNTYKLTRNITKYQTVNFYIWITKGNEDFRSKTKVITFYENKDVEAEISEEEINGVKALVKILDEEIEKSQKLIKGLEDFSVTLQYPTFEINNNMELEVHTADNMNNLDFAINENGELEVQL